jgi:hypothetical protein
VIQSFPTFSKIKCLVERKRGLEKITKIGIHLFIGMYLLNDLLFKPTNFTVCDFVISEPLSVSVDVPEGKENKEK